METRISVDTRLTRCARGANDSGQLGNGSTVADSASPVIVDRRTQNATQTVAGYTHAFTVDPDGSLWAWGANNNGELGLGTAGPTVRAPQKVPGLTGVTQLTAAAEINMALRSDGTLLVWGYEGFGLRGDGIPRTHPGDPGARGHQDRAQRVHRPGTSPGRDHAERGRRAADQRGGATAGHRALVQVTTVPGQPICHNVGLVESQTPPAGTVVAPGGHATIRVYVPPPAGCF